MVPVVALAGRPNVGKSTIFNRLTRSRDALVANFPGLTRDRQYGHADADGQSYIVIDTGGIDGTEEGVEALMAGQSIEAMREADIVIFVVDCHEGLIAGDDVICKELRKLNKKVFLVANKIDGTDPDAAIADFYSLGMGEIFQISAAHGTGMAHFLDESLFPAIRQVAAEKRKQEAEKNGEELPEEYVHKAPEEDDVNRDNRVTFMFRGDRIPRFRDDLTYEWVPYDAVKLQEHVEFSRHHGAIMLSVYHDGVDSLMQFDEGDRLMGADIVFYVKYIQELPYVSLPEDDPSVLDPKPEDGNETEEPEDLKKHSDPDLSQPVKFAIVGRPNVGKSTLVNRILGESRVIVYDQPGTTRDSIYIPMERGGRQYVIIDTAGVRKRKKVTEVVEKFSVIKTLRAIDDCNVAVLVIDARESVSEQDLGLLSYIISAGRSLVICVNKWDGLSQDQKEKIKIDLQLKLGFVDFADVHFISALHGTGVGNIFDSINEAYRSAVTKISTSMLTRLIIQAQNEHQPPLVSGRRVKLKYAHAGGYNPPKIIIHGNMVDKLPGFYKHYLINYIRKALDIRGTPLDISFLEGENPYENRSDRKTRSEKRAQQRRDKERGRGKPDRKDGQPGKPRASSGRPGQGRGRK